MKCQTTVEMDCKNKEFAIGKLEIANNALCLIYNGKKISLELTEEQAKSIIQQTAPKRTDYEEAQIGSEVFYLSESCGVIKAQLAIEGNDMLNRLRFDAGNYFTDENLAKDRAKLINILNVMYKWAAENTEPVNIRDYYEEKFVASYDYYDREVDIRNMTVCDSPILPAFQTRQDCQNFINQFKDELIWLFNGFTYRVKE